MPTKKSKKPRKAPTLDPGVSPNAILMQLNRVLSHPEFQGTPQQRDFLRLVVMEILKGREHEIKGYTVATQVLGRRANFDPKTNPADGGGMSKACEGLLFGMALLVSAAVMIISCPARAGELGHYAPGVLNIRDFFVPEPGWYALVYNVFYTTDTFRDRNGNKVDSIKINPGPGPGVTIHVDADVDVYSLAPTLIWVAPWKLPGGLRYGAYISPTFANSSVSASLSTETWAGLKTDEGQFGVGDMYVEPLFLGWSGKHWDLALGYGFYAPVGKYDTKSVTFPILGLTITSPAPDNIGLGFWTHQFQTAAAWYPWEHRATAVMVALTGEVHGKKQGIDVTPGSHITWNWGISQFLPLKKDESLLLEIGPVGYSQWQVSDDTGSAVRNPDVHDQVHAAGVQLGVTHVPWAAFLTAKYVHEFGAEDRFEGQMATVTFGKKF